MKNLLLLIAFTLMTAALNAQSDAYTQALTKAVTALDSAKTPADYQAAANTFARIDAAEPGEWLPAYYAAFCQVQTAFPLFQEDATKAALLVDMAQRSLDKAKALAPQEPEIAVMQAFILIGRLMENPMAKGAEITPQVFAELGKATALDPKNPRAFFLKGTYTLNMPEFYGGGADNARPLFEKAAGLFEAETDRGVQPHWGKGANAEYLARVQAAEKSH